MREVLIGDLAYVQLATVLQIMENEQLSGWVQTRAGTVVVRGGLVVDIDVDGLPAADAMMRLIDQEQGGFIVEAGSPPNQTPLGTVPALLMQAARLKDEWQRSRMMVYQCGEGELPDALEPLEAHFDGTRTLEQVLDAADAHVSEIIDAIQDAVQSRALELGPAPLAQPGSNVPDAEDDAETSSEPELVHAGQDD